MCAWRPIFCLLQSVPAWSLTPSMIWADSNCSSAAGRRLPRAKRVALQVIRSSLPHPRFQEVLSAFPCACGRYTILMPAVTRTNMVQTDGHSSKWSRRGPPGTRRRWLLLSLDRLTSNELTMTQELIANMLGVRRECVTEAAGHLQARLDPLQPRQDHRARPPQAGGARVRVLRRGQTRIRPPAAAGRHALG